MYNCTLITVPTFRKRKLRGGEGPSFAAKTQIWGFVPSQGTWSLSSPPRAVLLPILPTLGPSEACGWALAGPGGVRYQHESGVGLPVSSLLIGCHMRRVESPGLGLA